jgi:hypothetical protein
MARCLPKGFERGWLRPGEGFAFPVAMPQLVEQRGDLAVRAGLEQHVGWRKLLGETGRITSIAQREWASTGQSF